MTIEPDIRAIVSDRPGTFGVYARNLDTFEEVGVTLEDLVWLMIHLPQASMSTDWGFDIPVRVYNKTGLGLGTCIDSGRFETDGAAWIVAAQAKDQQDFGSRPEDAAPSTFGEIGKLLYERWGNQTTGPAAAPTRGT